jgi:excisionase family DNA binding protein
MEKNILTLEEAAELLKVSKATLRRWIKAGKIPTFQVGRFYRIRESDIDKLFIKQK